jgi:hypothetical protein
VSLLRESDRDIVAEEEVSTCSRLRVDAGPDRVYRTR